MRKSAGLLLAASALLFFSKSHRRSRIPKLQPARSQGERDAADKAARRYILYFIFPVWCTAGFLDWLWHKQTKIETTSGITESIAHQIMMISAGGPMMAGLFLETNAGVLATMLAGWLIHEITVGSEVHYSLSRRKIPTREQQTHSFLESIPFDITAMLACLHPEEFLSLFRVGGRKPDFHLRLKKPAMPLTNAAAIIMATSLLVGLPHAEELWRCYRARQKGLAGTDIPDCARELYAA